MSFVGGNRFAAAAQTSLFPMITFFEKKDDEEQGVGFYKIPKLYVL